VCPHCKIEKLKTLARDGYALVTCELAVFKPEVGR
jgi:uncharacterized protein YjhX (UPF0386 family)